MSALVALEDMTAALEAAEALKLGDYFAMRLGKRSKPVDGVETYRFAIAVTYEDGRLFEHIQIDVGLTDPWLGTPERVTAPPLLEFAGIEPVSVRVIPIEQHLAEKIHAYTKDYGKRESTRVKDLVDMVLLVDAAELNGESLGRTLRAVFGVRESHAVPTVLPPPPTAWRAPYARLAAHLPVPKTADEAHQYVAAALHAALDGWRLPPQR